MSTRQPLAQWQQGIADWRRYIHKHPELGFEETCTADFVAEKLHSFGIEVHRVLAKQWPVPTRLTRIIHRRWGRRTLLICWQKRRVVMSLSATAALSLPGKKAVVACCITLVMTLMIRPSSGAWPIGVSWQSNCC